MCRLLRELGWAVTLVATLAWGCAGPEPIADATPAPASVPEPTVVETADETAVSRVARGEVRGEVVSMPEETDTEPMVGIRHEDIAITTADGEPWEMGSMTMPFAVSDAVALDAIEKGDKVAFTLEVDLDDGMTMTVTEMRPLDAETPLAWEAESDAVDDPGAAEQHDDHGGH